MSPGDARSETIPSPFLTPIGFVVAAYAAGAIGILFGILDYHADFGGITRGDGNGIAAIFCGALALGFGGYWTHQWVTRPTYPVTVLPDALLVQGVRLERGRGLIAVEAREVPSPARRRRFQVFIVHHDDGEMTTLFHPCSDMQPTKDCAKALAALGGFSYRELNLDGKLTPTQVAYEVMRATSTSKRPLARAPATEPAREPSTEPARGLGVCPRCDEALPDSSGPLFERACPFCRGRFLESAGTERLLEQELGLGKEELRELIGMYGGRNLVCPGCASGMQSVPLKGATVDLCPCCGGLWTDKGELERVSEGRHVG